jgi:hypothetical protein
MRRRFVRAAIVFVLAALVFSLSDRQAGAYISNPVTMKSVLAQTQMIFTAKVETFDPEKRTATLTVDEHLKGKVPFKKLSMALEADKEGAREYNRPSHLLKRLAVKQTVVIFADNKEGAFAPIRRGNLLIFLYTNGTWVQFAAETTEDGPADLSLKFHHFEPYLQRTFKGTTEDMRQVIVDGLSGKKDPPPDNPKEPGGLGPEIKR